MKYFTTVNKKVYFDNNGDTVEIIEHDDKQKQFNFTLTKDFLCELLDERK